MHSVLLLHVTLHNATVYFNREQFYSIILTGFSDSEHCFCHGSTGHPGSWHDYRAFQNTCAAQLLEEDPHVLEGMHHLRFILDSPSVATGNEALQGKWAPNRLTKKLYKETECSS